MTTDGADRTGSYSFVLGGTLDGLGGAAAVDCYFEYSPEGASSWSSTVRETRKKAGRFSGEVTGLVANTTYEYRAVATENGSRTVYGEALTFRVPGERPTVGTGDVADLETTAARLNGDLTTLGDAGEATCYFRYRFSGGKWRRTGPVTLDSPGPFSARTTDLDPDRGYEFLAIAEGDNGTASWGESGRFRTAPTLAVATDPATAVEDRAFTLEGEVADLGGTDGVDVHFTYFEAGDPTGKRTDTATLEGPGRVSARVTDLTPSTEYGYELRASTGDGESVGGGLRSVRTGAGLTLSTAGATDVSPTGATLTATVEDLGGAASATVTLEYRASGTATWTTAGSRTVQGVGDVTAHAGGLSNDTEYEYRATAAASDGDTATGGAGSFTTPAANHPPTVEALDARDAADGDPHVDVLVAWTVADADRDLASVTVTVRDEGGVVYVNTTSVSGGHETGTDALSRLEGGDGRRYTVTLHAVDGDGATTARETVVEVRVTPSRPASTHGRP